MVTAIVLINARRGTISDTAEALMKLDDVAEVYSVAGAYDMVAIIRAATNERMAEIVTSHMLKMDNIDKTTTLVAFKAYSHYDLERMFSIGFEGKE
jgi:DNA-binding Lrp family transcriptional regulator